MPRLGEEQIRLIPSLLVEAMSLLTFRVPPPLLEGSSTGSPAALVQAWRFLNCPVVTPVAENLTKRELSKSLATELELLGRNLSDVAKISHPGSCVGSFDSALPFEGGAMVSGWAWDRGNGVSPRRVVLADRGGTIVGLASGGEVARPDVVTARLGIEDRTTGWEGFSKQGRSVSAYAMLETGEACRLNGQFNIVPELTKSLKAVHAGPLVMYTIRLRVALNIVYGIVLPPLLFLGLMALPTSIWMEGGVRLAATDPILLTAVVCWVMSLSLVTLLVIMSVSVSHTLNYSYISPAYALTTIASVLSLWRVTHRFRRGEHPV